MSANYELANTYSLFERFRINERYQSVWYTTVDYSHKTK